MALTLEMVDGLAVYGPATGEALPGVVIVHGSEGPAAGWSHRFAAILAAHGMLAMPWAYGSGDLWHAGPIADVDLRGLVEAGCVLAAHPRCRGVGVFGWSFGGGLVLIASALQGPEGPFRAVASHAGADFVTQAFDPANFVTGEHRRRPEGDAPRAFVWPGEEAALTPGLPLPLERVQIPVFLSVGDADPVWPHSQTLNVAQRLRDMGREVDLMVGEGQGHGYDLDREPELWARLLGFFGKHL